MPFTKQGPYSAGGAFTNANANNIEVQYDEATQSFEQDLLTPFVFSGFTAARDGTTLSQLDVAAGVAFPKQTDNTLRRRSLSSSTQSTSGHPSTTMYLFLNPDSTWAWQTSSTPPTNALAICHVTTDGSSNILTVVDDRVTGTTLFGGMTGALAIPSTVNITGNLSVSGNATLARITADSSKVTTDGSGNLSVTGNLSVSGNATLARITADGGNATTDGSGKLTITSMASSGLLTVTRTLSGSIKEFLRMATTDSNTYGIVVDSDGAWKIRNIGSGTNILTVDASGNINNPAGAGIPTTRNGAALSVPIYTGATTPSNPPTGSIWASA
ncbi:MAG: hypothetical protein ACXWQR_19900 [Ktedonobacterales bacterium]